MCAYHKQLATGWTRELVGWMMMQGSSSSKRNTRGKKRKRKDQMIWQQGARQRARVGSRKSVATEQLDCSWGGGGARITTENEKVSKRRCDMTRGYSGSASAQIDRKKRTFFFWLRVSHVQRKNKKEFSLFSPRPGGSRRYLYKVSVILAN